MRMAREYFSFMEQVWVAVKITLQLIHCDVEKGNRDFVNFKLRTADVTMYEELYANKEVATRKQYGKIGRE